MSKKRNFLPPLINPMVVGAMWLLFPFLLRWGGLSVKIDPQSLQKLREYRGTRMLLLPNHPTGEEPVVLFEIWRAMGEVFNVVAAREVFDWEHGFRGWVLRRVGAYSIIRGSADRESFMTSKKILMEGLHRLVIFIEGEISRGGETLIPFEPGVIQLAFWAQEGLLKIAAKTTENPEASPESPPVFIAPVAIKYFYLDNCEPDIERAMIHLETAVGIVITPDMNRYDRLRAVGLKILEVQESMHQLGHGPELTLTERVATIKHRILNKMEIFLDLKPDPQANTLTRLREIRNTMDHLIHSYEDPVELTDYEKRMVEHLRGALSEFYTDLDRVVYFLTYNENYLQGNQTPERFIDTIRRLEKEVYGKPRLSPRRVAHVKVGEIISLKDEFPKYEQDKKNYAKIMAAELEEDMRLLLVSMQR